MHPNSVALFVNGEIRMSKAKKPTTLSRELATVGIARLCYTLMKDGQC